MTGATLVLDFHQAGYDPEREPQRSELAVTAVASLAHILYLMGEPVGLVSNARDAADRIRRQGFQYDFRTRRRRVRPGWKRTRTIACSRSPSKRSRGRSSLSESAPCWPASNSTTV